MPAKLCLYCSLLALLVGSCTVPATETPGEDSVADPLELQTIHDELVAAFNGTDAQAAASFYAQDGIRIVADGSLVEGLEAIRQDFESFIGIDDWSIDVGTPTVFVSGDLAVTVADYVESGITSEDGSPQPNEVGYWLFVWQLESDGSWKAIREIWSDRPEP